MAKITRADGPSYVDDNGDPQQGPVGMVVEPTAAGDQLVEQRTDEHGEQTEDTTDYATQNVAADGQRDTDASASDGQFVDASGAATQFDPAAHTVTEVNDYLAAVGEDERVRVLNAEGNGKNRSGIMNGRVAGMATDPQDADQTDGDSFDDQG